MAPNEAYEHSEMLLYRAMVLEEGGRLDEALTHLDLYQVPPPSCKALAGSQASQKMWLQRARLRECWRRTGRDSFQADVKLWPACLQDKIKDKLGLLERRASLLLKIPGRSGNAEANFRCGGLHCSVHGTGHGNRSR